MLILLKINVDSTEDELLVAVISGFDPPRPPRNLTLSGMTHHAMPSETLVTDLLTHRLPWILAHASVLPINPRLSPLPSSKLVWPTEYHGLMGCWLQWFREHLQLS